MTNEQMKQRKETLLALFSDSAYRPMKLKELAVFLDVPRERREDLKEVLDVLISEGKASVSEKGRYGKPGQDLVTGTYRAYLRGLGYVEVHEWENGIFIPAAQNGGAMHGDTVQVLIEKEEDGSFRAEGSVVRILERANRTVAGLFQKGASGGFVLPDNPNIFAVVWIPGGQEKGAVSGQKVVAEITSFADREGEKPEGCVTEILGDASDPGVDALSVIRSYHLPDAFPEEVMAQADSFGDAIGAEEIARRLDLRALPTVTIDGEDAKDLDDAVTLSKENEKHYTLGVHIADVSHYVTEGSPLDKEAKNRGTSVYLTGHVIPMLPHRLSNGLCSLNEGEDRLALSCLMEIDAKGRLLSHRVVESVIRVDRRMTYTAVDAIVSEHDPAMMEQYAELVPLFERMKELSDILRGRRGRRGAIDFDFPESRIVLDPGGKPLEIRPYLRSAATRIIEDFMLMANETIAEDYFWQETPFLYRTHENPDPERMKKLGAFLQSFGYTLRARNREVHPKEIQKLLARIEGTPEEALISRMVLRSMKRARYTVECTGHFGLAAHYYTHFTSPIRRYPDLQIHRIIKESLRGGLTVQRIAHYEQLLPGVASWSSSMERRAAEAEREIEKLKKCEYMLERIGEVCEGIISDVSDWGLYVELSDTVTGMVPVSTLGPDRYYFSRERMELTGRQFGSCYRLGQRVKIQVKGVDPWEHIVKFALYEE